MSERLARCARCDCRLQTLTHPRILVVMDIQGFEVGRLCCCEECFLLLQQWLASQRQQMRLEEAGS